MQVIQIEVPPLLISGRGWPVIGNSSTETPILTRAWNTIGTPRAITSSEPNTHSALFEMMIILSRNNV